MYKAVGDAAYNDGLFSQAAPYQAYQASVSQFGDGGLGASKQSNTRFLTQMRKGRYVGASPRVRPLVKPHVSGLGATSSLVPTMVRTHKGRTTRQGVSGPGASYNGGSLGRTFLPAFSAREMQGLGYSFRDGSLGDVIDVAACDAIAPCVNNTISARGESMDEALKKPFNQIVALSLVGIAAYLYMKR